MNQWTSSLIKIIVSCSLFISSVGWSQTPSFANLSPEQTQSALSRAREGMLKAEGTISQSVQFLDSNLRNVSLSNLSQGSKNQVTVRETKSGLMIRFTPRVSKTGKNVMILERLNHNGMPEQMTTIIVDDLQSLADVEVKFENAFAVLAAQKVGAHTSKASRTIAADMWSVSKGCAVPIGSSTAKETTYYGPGYLFIMLGIMAAILFGPSIKIPAGAAKPIVYICIALMVGVPLFMMITEKEC